MPLKHLTETAYMLLLALVICIAGFLASLLPPYPAGMPYWAILVTVFFLYPLLFTRTFRVNRADYEFRLLHWFPAAILFLWLALQLLAPRFKILHILNLGFLFLWSLPLVALGITFIIIFAFHVIRRRTFRVTALALILALFTAGAVAAEGMNWNPRMQAAIFPEERPTLASIGKAFSSLGASLGFGGTSSGKIIAQNGSASSVPAPVVRSSSRSSTASSAARSSRASSVGQSFPSGAVASSARSSSVMRSSSSSRAVLPPVMSSVKPNGLANSGPVEAVALLAVTLAGLYFGVLHKRAEGRA